MQPRRVVQSNFCHSHHLGDWDLLGKKWKLWQKWNDEEIVDMTISPKWFLYHLFDSCYMIFIWYMHGNYLIYMMYMVFTWWFPHVIVICTFRAKIWGEKTQISRGARQICPKALEKFDSKELVELIFLQLWYPVGFTSNKIKQCGLFIWYNLCYLCGISYTETCHVPLSQH